MPRPLLFLLYTSPLSHLVQASDINHHLFADDTQRHQHMQVANVFIELKKKKKTKQPQEPHSATSSGVMIGSFEIILSSTNSSMTLPARTEEEENSG